ncbi:MAG: Na+/H+ antiporter NhaC family protein [bacterium]
MNKIKVPHVFVLLTFVILACATLTYVVPSGSYSRETREVDGHERTLLVPGTYERMDKHFSIEGFFLGRQVDGEATPVGLYTFLTAIPRGLEARADIIFFIFFVGGVFGVLQRTKVIAAAIQRLLRRLGNAGPLLTIVLMIVLAIGGSTLGMGEEFIPLIPVFLLVSHRLGYDRIYGMGIVEIAAATGFAASTTNPFTVGVAQSIAEVPLYSGMGLRFIFLACALALAIVHMLRYGARIKRDPGASLLADEPEPPLQLEAEEVAYRPHHTWIILSCIAIFGVIVYGMQQLGWWMADMAGGFFLMAIVAIIVARLPLAEAVKAFVKGMEEMVVAALVVGWAYGIAIVMQDGKILDSIVYGAASVLQSVPRNVAAISMLGYESFLNFFIPSGSGQAAVSMPLMAPLADILGISRQTAVFAFTCGDGFSNTIIPTSGILMAMLGLARIPYGKWLRFMLPLFGQLMLLAAVFLTLAVFFNYR